MTERFITPEKLIARRFCDQRDVPSWDAAVLCFRDLKGSEALIQALSGQPVGRKVFWGMEETGTFPNVYTAEVDGKRIGIVARCVWGGPQASILVEELSAMRVPVVIGYGAAGSLDATLSRGSQLAIELALASDGTSGYYGTGPFQPDEALLDSGISVPRVTAATVDAVYRETPMVLNKWKAHGARVVNMEVAPFYAAAKTCGIRALWLGHVSDVLVGDWEDWYVERRDMNAGTIENCLAVIRTLKPRGERSVGNDGAFNAALQP